MNSATFNKRLHKLEKIYEVLIKHGLIDDSEKIDLPEILENLYFLNLLIFKSYKIFNSDMDESEKIRQLSLLQTPNGKPLLDETMAKKVFNLYSKSLSATIDKIKFNQESLLKEEEVIRNIPNHKGGFNEEVYKDNEIDKFLLSIKGNKKIENQVLKLAHSLKSIAVNTNLTTNDVAATISGLKSGVKNVVLVGPRMVYNTAEYMFNWVFFPLYQLQGLPVIGSLMDIPLDIIGLIIDNSDLLMEFMGPLLPVVLDLITKVIGLIPLAGSVSSAIGIALTFVKPSLTWVLTDGTDLLGLFLNIQRKEWGLAYISCLEIIPNMPAIMDAVLTNMTKTNKYLYKIRYVTETVDDITDLGISITSEFLHNPMGFLQPKFLWKKIIYPNKKKIPILKKIPFDKINKVLPYIYMGYNVFNTGIHESQKLLNNSLDNKLLLKDKLNIESLGLASNVKGIKEIKNISNTLTKKYDQIEKGLSKTNK
tara:strand:+ start:15358 stop:16794 length:1437 start_codon:yes stop_codon:yes gene_type:complete